MHFTTGPSIHPSSFTSPADGIQVQRGPTWGGELRLLESGDDGDLRPYVHFSAHLNCGLYLNSLNAVMLAR